jgi:hypothetical protein
MLSENGRKPVICENFVQIVRQAWLRRNTTFSSYSTAVFYRTVRLRITRGARIMPPDSDLQQAPPHCDRHCLRTIVSPQLVYQVLDMKIYCGFGN